jgi:hypothetical protein
MRDDNECGPWSVSMLSKPQLRPYYVSRQYAPIGWEQLHKPEGGIARFETLEEAQQAADDANAKRPNSK